MAKAQNKTKATEESVEGFIDKQPDPTVREDCRTLLKLMKRVTKAEPKLWSNGMIGFGDLRYRSPATGREGDWFKAGFSPRKANLTIMGMTGYLQFPALLKKLGPYKTSGGCLYIKRLKDVDLKVLEELVAKEMVASQKVFAK